ncbi:MAG: lysophospholipid acyltransferase family protein, partial [Pseudomonadota bacterium]|nr:lysophospholipid acyltransferase family protein [Pseudomonadota bacterium]
MLRSALFLLTYAFLTIFWGSLGVLVGWMLPYRQRFAFIIGAWTAMVLWAFEHLCQVQVEVEGQDDLPATPCLVLARHESTWETLFLQQLFAPQATVIKKELLAIPFFGWAFSLLRPIAIDRKDGRGALKTLIREGTARLKSGSWVVLFPEGTRLAPKEQRQFGRGGPALALAAKVPVLLVAHTAGDRWPARKWRKSPGKLRVRISPPFV